MTATPGDLEERSPLVNDMTSDEYRRILDAINGAGYGWSSEWIGAPGERSGAMFKAYRGVARPRKVGEWVGEDPADVARKAATALGVTW